MFLTILFNNTFEQFCSKLVAEAYFSAGIELFIDKTCQNVHPGDYEKCGLLKKINVEFDELSKEEALANPQLLGQEESLYKLRKILKEIYNENNLKFDSVNQTLTDFIFIPQNERMDSKIANALIETSYTTFWKEEMRVNIYMYDFEQKYNYFQKKNKKEIFSVNLSFINTSIEEIKRYYTELYKLEYLENKELREEISKKKVVDQELQDVISSIEKLYKGSILDSSEIRKVLIDLYSNLLKKTKKMLITSLFILEELIPIKLYENTNLISFLEEELLENYNNFIDLKNEIDKVTYENEDRIRDLSS